VLDFVYLIPAFPLLGFAVLVLFGKKLGDPKAGWVGFTAVLLAFISTLVTWLGLLTHDGRVRTWDKNAFTWIHIGSLNVHVSFLVDPLSMVMALFVTGVSTLIHMYSVAYMKGDKRYHQFFVYLNLFVFSMLMLVLADNLLVLFLGWEGVGACSYFLVGFWFERASAATAAKKAFIVNRIGDVGLLLGIFVVFNATGTLTFWQAQNTAVKGFLDYVPLLGSGTLTAIGLLLFVGAVGKSAQLPLYVWLPDAMEGPTPVSALIHAATMVTAGVYLMVRVAPVLHVSHAASLTVAIVGVAGALFAATVACAQSDIKRVLAYSTMSQLGYMFLAVGSGAYDMGIFHMVTHAFFKALLFLSAGSVIHALHEEQDLKNMGNLRKYIPVTFASFLIGWLAISGIPPFAGFWSKDEVLLAAWNYNKALWAIGLVTVVLTAYYMSRLFFLAFYGKDRWQKSLNSHGAKGSKPHESSRIMTFPMLVLSALSVLGGLLDVTFKPFREVLTNFLAPDFSSFVSPLPTTSAGTKWVLDGAGAACALLGIGISWAISKRSSPWPVKLEPKVLARAWFIDPLYEFLFARPGAAIAGWFSSVFDGRIVDGLVNGSARVVNVTGVGLKRVQSGYVRAYATSIACGTALVLIWALIRSAR
jgi:NADH-quinone oxidoreductase subunit L